MKLFLIFLLAITPSVSLAYLGEKKTSGQSRTMTRSVNSSYSTVQNKVEEVDVTEFVDASGKVFALGWKGMTHPDLESLLGSYWPEYVSKKRPSQRRFPKRVTKTESIVVEKSGKMREVHGKAYIKSMIPDGFNLDQFN